MRIYYVVLATVLSASSKGKDTSSNSTRENETLEAEEGINYLNEDSVLQNEPNHTDDCPVAFQEIDDHYNSTKEDSLSFSLLLMGKHTR